MSEKEQITKMNRSIPELIARTTTGKIKTALCWSEHKTQARQTMTPSVTIYWIKVTEEGSVHRGVVELTQT
jgi:hypothetical protein